MATTFDLLTQACNEDPLRPRLTFLHDDGTQDRVDGATLIQRAVRMSEGMRQIGSTGDRVLLAYPPGNDFLVGFLGCLHAGRIPVPVSYPKPRRPLSRYAAIASDAAAEFALTSPSMLSRIDPETMNGDHGRAIPWYSEVTLAALTRPIRSPDCLRSGDDTVFLQYTSGSTRRPKGVMVTHNNLLSNLDAIRQGFQIDNLPRHRRVVFSWLPAYHDMGLIGILLSALAYDGHAVTMSPTTFVRDPARWLRGLSDHRAAITVAPCFGYRWAANKIVDEELGRNAVDLSRVELAACGAEPINADELEHFADRFEQFGFDRRVYYPCYGLAESTLMVTGADRGNATTRDELPGIVNTTISQSELAAGKFIRGEGNDTVRIVSSGIPAAGTEIRIVDPQTNRPLPAGTVGEIRIRSQSVAVGYWNDPRQTDQTFRTRVNGSQGWFLKTGDLGVLSEGQLFVTGRIKDVIIVGGQNHYPQDIERTVAAVDERLRDGRSAAFSMVDDRPERLGIVQEVPRAFPAGEARQVIDKIRVAVAREHDLSIDTIALIRWASLPRTSSGKVQRARCRDLLAAKDLKSVAVWDAAHSGDHDLFPDLDIAFGGTTPTVAALGSSIQQGILSWLCHYLEASELRADQSFAEMGVGSLMAVDLAQRLETWLDVRLSPVAAWSYPTPATLSHYLAEQMLGAEAVEQPDERNEEYQSLLRQVQALDENEAKELLKQLS